MRKRSKMPRSNECRFCFEEKENSLQIDEEIQDIYTNVTNMNLELSNDSLPKISCMTCYQQLYSAYTFKLKLINVEKKLLSRIQKNEIKVPEPVNSILNESPEFELLDEIFPCIPAKRRRQSSDSEQEQLSTIAQLTASTLLQFKEEPICEVDIENDEDNGDDEGVQFCDQCNANFETQADLALHNISTHTRKARPSNVDKNWRDKIYHFLIAKGDGLFCCGICQKESNRKPHLVRHIETTHLKTRYFCKVEGCFYSCNRKDKYGVHIRTMHSQLPSHEIEAHLSYMREMSPDEIQDLDDEYKKIRNSREMGDSAESDKPLLNENKVKEEEVHLP